MRENQPYWLDNVLVRYDNLASEVQAKIVAVQAAQRQYLEHQDAACLRSRWFFVK